MALTLDLTPVLDDPEQDILHLTPSLRVRCREHFLRTKEIADKMGLSVEFAMAFEIAHEWTKHGGRVVEIYSDFAPLSFGYAILTSNGETVIAGGLIYQGPSIPADGSFPSLTVSMDASRVGWFFHS